MTPDQVTLMRRLALNDGDAISSVMSGELVESPDDEGRTAALLRITALLCVDSDPCMLRSATDQGLAAGVSDDDIFYALMVVAPIIGAARLSAAVPQLMAALDLEVIDD